MIAHCGVQIHIKHRDASCCERNVYDILISLDRVFVFELWIGYNLVLRLKILPKGLSHFGISEKQDSSKVKPQRIPRAGHVGWVLNRQFGQSPHSSDLVLGPQRTPIRLAARGEEGSYWT